MKTKRIFLGNGYKTVVRSLRPLLVMLLFILGAENTWGYAGKGHYVRLRVFTENTAKGLVYASQDSTSTPSDDKYKDVSLTDRYDPTNAGRGSDNNGGVSLDFYAWAKPARGYKFDKWTAEKFDYVNGNYSNMTNFYEVDAASDPEGAAVTIAKNCDGDADNIKSRSWGGGKGWEVANSAKAGWLDADKFTVRYKKPKGGTYSVKYEYLKTEGYEFKRIIEDVNLTFDYSDEYWVPEGVSANDKGYSFATDEVVLTVPTEADNFLGWYDNSGKISSDKLLEYEISKTTDIEARFKLAVFDPVEQQTINTNSNTDDEELIIVVNPDCAGVWEASDFTVELNDKQGAGLFSGEIVSYSEEDGLKIKITFNANGIWGGSGVTADIVPEYGETLSISIIALAEEIVDYEARLIVNDEIVDSGFLTEMLDAANDIVGNDLPTIQLTQDIELSTLLSIHRPMILDLNSKKLSSTTLTTMISNTDNIEGSINFTITDNSFLHTGEISLINSGAADIVGIRIENGNKLQLNGGKITFENTIGRAYGVRISGNSNMNMTGGSVFSHAFDGAYGIYVVGSNDYATLNGGSVIAHAEKSALGVWSAGTVNITNTSITAQTTNGIDATGIYVKSGIAVLDNANVGVEATDDNAYGAYVEAGKLIVNRGVFAISTGGEGAYGVNIQSGGQAVIQNATISSQAENQAYGLYNNNLLQLQNNTITVVSEGSLSMAIFADEDAEKTTIEEGSYAASSGSGNVYAIYHKKGELTVEGGSFQASSEGDNVYSVYSSDDATLQNARLTAVTTGEGKNVYGFTATTGTAHVLKLIEINSTSATSSATGVESNGSMALSDCSLMVKTSDGSDAYGLKIQTGILEMSNTNVDVRVHTIGAYGIYAETDVEGNISGGNFSVVARQAKQSSLTTEESVLYGVKVSAGSDIRIENARFDVEAENTSRAKIAYGVYSSGKTTLKDCFFDVSTRDQSYGVWGDASSNLNMLGNEIQATSQGATTAYGVYSNGDFDLAGGKVTTQVSTTKSYALFFGADARGKVKSGKYKAIGNVNSQSQETAPVNTQGVAGSVAIEGGFFEESTNLAYYTPSGYSVYAVDNTAEEYAEGYYYQVSNALITNNVCYIPQINTGYKSLEAAMDYARDHSATNVTIVMTQPYTLIEGTYTLPSNATLLVPYSRTQTSATKTNPASSTEYKMLTEHLRLTFATNAILNVDGIIEVGAEHYYTNIGRLGTVQGPYGRLHLEEGSKIVMNDKACLYAWGYVTGDGEIFVKKGAKVYEDFQVNDMRNGPVLLDPFLATTNKQTYKVFPVNQYYIQNVEAPTRYYYGSSLIAFLKFQTGISTENMTAMIVGNENALFKATLDDESSWVRKVYDYKKDSCIWETNASAEIGSLLIEGGNYSMDSRLFVLPITNNMRIHAISGKLDITQSMVLLAGAQLEVNKEATVVVKEKDTNDVPQDVTLYLYDKEEWGQYAYGKYVSPVAFSPSWTNGKCPRGTEYADMGDASIYIKGKLEVNGTMRTTNGGAKIYSDVENAGTIDYKKQAPGVGEQTVYVYASNPTGSVIANNESMTDTYRKAAIAAKLANASGYISTAGTESGSTYCYMDMEDGMGARWVNLKTIDACLVQDQGTGVFYAKPSDYVALTSGEEDTNHLYHAAEDGNWTYIRQSTDAGCQWWKVIPTETNGVYYCEGNGIYYTYSNTKGWEEVRVEVTFYLDEDKSKSHTLTVNYGSKPNADIISNPSKSADVVATYQFFGWKSSVTQNEYAYTAELEEAKEDMYYTPIFTSLPKNYTITLNEANNGAAVPVEVPYGSHPSYEPKKDPTAQYTYYFLNWTDASSNTYAADEPLPAVTGATSYTAHWAQVVNKYTITWKEGDEVLETDTKQEYGSATAFNGTLPTKEADNEFAYSFSGWKSSLTGSTYANGSTPTVGGATTYTAQYSTKPRYKITFANYDGTDLQKDYYVTQGEKPIYNGLTPGRARDLDGYFRFIGWKNSAGDPFEPSATLPAVTGKETYTAQYAYVTELYTITLNNIDGAGGTWSGKFGVGSMPFYNRDNNDVAVEPAKASTNQYEYTFTGWTPELQAVSGETTYTAQFEEHTRKYEITFANLDGNGTQQTIEVEYGQMPVCPIADEDIKKVIDHTTYAFAGWNKTIVSVSGDATYMAQFSSTGTVETFPITFDLDNGSAPVVMNVAYNTLPVIENPTKEADEAFTYSFNRWEPAIVNATEPATYTAQYTQTLNKYTVRFVNYDDRELQSSDFVYGSTPTYSGETPKKPLDEANGKAYTFNGWSPAIGSVTGNVTYTAQFDEVALVATVTTEDGDVNGYDSWSDAYSNRANNCTIKLYKDVTGLTTMQALDKAGLTLDLNGHTISGTCASNRGIVSVTAANVTITDSSAGKTGTISGSGSVNNLAYTLYINGGSLTIDYASVSAQNTKTSNQSNAYAVNVNSGSVVINNGKFKATSNRTSTSGRTLSAVYIKSGQTATIKGGYYSNSVTAATGYECLSTTELNGYSHKVTPKTNINYTVKHFQQNLNNDEYTEVTADRETKQGTTATATAAEANSYAGFTAQPFEQGTIAGDESTVVNIYYNRNKHTVTWLNGETAIETDENVKFGATPSYDGETPTKIREDYTCVFTGWSPEIVPLEDHNTTYTAQFEETPLEFVVVDEHPVNVTTDVTSTTVTTTGDLEVTEGNTLTTTDLVLEASLVDDEGVSGEIRGAGTVNPTGNVYFDLTLNTWARHWRAFGVPWKIANLHVTKLVEIKTKNGTPCHNELVLGRDYDIVYYNGATRAQQGPGRHCWDYVEDGDGTLDPGKAYLIGFIRPTGTVRFTKEADAPIRRSNETLDVPYYEGNGVGTDAGWNAIANPKTYHASMDAGVSFYHVHNGDTMRSDGFTTKVMSDVKFVVGTAVFVQANPEKPVVAITRQHHSPSSAPAPRRVASHEDAPQYHAIHIMSNNKSADRIYIKADEDKEADAYTNGIDVAKLGISTVRAQIWVERYNTQLAVNTMAPVNNTVSYPLGISVPQAGEYEIQLSDESSDMIYLTYDDRVIWNLSYAPYTADLEKGTNSHYGIRMVVSRTPAVATGFDEALVDAQGETKKVLIEDKVYIIRGENVYSVDGQLVK